MTREEWGEIPTPIITRLIRSIRYYAETIEEKEQELRNISVNIRVLDDEIDIKNGVVDDFDALFDDNDFLLSEDMIGQIREIIYKRDLFLQFRETNEHSINTDVI